MERIWSFNTYWLVYPILSDVNSNASAISTIIEKYLSTFAWSIAISSIIFLLFEVDCLIPTPLPGGIVFAMNNYLICTDYEA